MSQVRKRIVTDENKKPVAALIDYADWLEIERLLGQQESGPAELSRYSGTVQLSEDPVAYQRRMREEWQ